MRHGRRARLLVWATSFVLILSPAFGQDAAPPDRNPVNTRSRPGGMIGDSPVSFPETGALPARYPPDLKAESFDAGEPGYYLFASPERSLAQVRAIQNAMPSGRFTPPENDWKHLARTKRILEEGGRLQVLALGDSIVNDTMRSGWIALLREAYPRAEITATVYVRGGGGCQHFKEAERLEKHVIPRRPDLVFIGGISQRDLASMGEVIERLRAALPEVEFLLGTGAFGTTDPRDAAALALAPHSGTGAYGTGLRKLAEEKGAAFVEFTRPWAQYLNSSGFHPHRFYRDVVHANEFGEQVLAKVFLAFWQPEPGAWDQALQPPAWSVESRTAPRPLRIHSLQVDLRDSRHQLDVAIAADPDGPGPAEAALEAPANLAGDADILAAINANAFGSIPPPVPGAGAGARWRQGQPVGIQGWAKSPAREASRPETGDANWSFWTTLDGRARVGRLAPEGAAGLAIAGFSPLVIDGGIRVGTDDGVRHPRTAIGVDRTGYRVVMVVVDGRQPGTSEGMSTHELAELMRSLGCHDALNLDGGGSSILLRRAADGRLAPVNRPSDQPPRPVPVMLVVRETGLARGGSKPQDSAPERNPFVP